MDPKRGWALTFWEEHSIDKGAHDCGDENKRNKALRTSSSLHHIDRMSSSGSTLQVIRIGPTLHHVCGLVHDRDRAGFRSHLACILLCCLLKVQILGTVNNFACFNKTFELLSYRYIPGTVQWMSKKMFCRRWWSMHAACCCVFEGRGSRWNNLGLWLWKNK